MSKYEELMDKITVTPEMQERILKNIREQNPEKKKIVSFQRIRKYASIAACLAVLIAGVTSMTLWNQHENGDQREEQNPGMEMTYGGVTEQENRESLEQAVGFPVQELSELPFEVTGTSYVSYWDQIAEITYSGTDGTIVFRKAVREKEAEDISGDFNEYEHEEQVIADETEITCRGNGEKEYVAVWQDGTYSYAILAEDGIAREEMLRLIEDCQYAQK